MSPQSSSVLDPRFLRSHLPPPLSRPPPSSWSSSVSHSVLSSWRVRGDDYVADLRRHWSDVGDMGRAAAALVLGTEVVEDCIIEGGRRRRW
eukprot:CAMPEP_0182469232 /NCGR_PEP_ID=MMETSP1319-20130603/16752_1 /TAXON_ID=172717 /ORGANISM="Bolidomonas pacifica, Strain RCC208" /LENGTH=90 /DNA_ID=CAMNT_0024669513 /DNA_START=91 /DNA_END=360 /DNA_ORIENTATION=-